MHVQTLGKVAPDLFVLGTIKNPIYLIGGDDEWALIEGGLEWMAPLVLRQIHECLPDRAYIRHWFITHSHYDHCGLIESLHPYLPGIQIHATAGVAKAFSSPRARAVVRDLNAKVRELSGFEQGTTSQQVEGGVDHRLPSTPIESIPVHVVAHGETVPVNGHQFRVIATPGHSRCSTSFLDEGNGRIFVSDALGELVQEDLWCPLAFDDLAQYRSSIERIDEVGATSIFLAHHGFLTGEQAAIAPRQAAVALDAFANDVTASLHGNGYDLEAAARAYSLRFREVSAPFIPPSLHEASMRRIIDLLGTEGGLPQPRARSA